MPVPIVVEKNGQLEQSYDIFSRLLKDRIIFLHGQVDDDSASHLVAQLLFLNHELMISRFHAMLELACRKFAGKVELSAWKQGAELWNRIELPKVRQDARGLWMETAATEVLPHRPDAFFTLRFLTKPEDQQLVHFLQRTPPASSLSSGPTTTSTSRIVSSAPRCLITCTGSGQC